METRWLYTASPDFAKLREASCNTCVIPMGCIEKHGLHLPVGTDIVKGSYIAHRASQLETVCIFPDFAFGDVPRGPHAERPDGTVCLDVRVQMTLLEQLCDEIAANGFNKILVANSHGGNSHWLNQFSRNWSMKPHKAVFAWSKVDIKIAPYGMAEILLKNGSGSIPELTKEDEELILRYYNEKLLMGHACFGETALVMAAAPESIHLDRLGIESGLPLDIPEVNKLVDSGVNIADNGWEYKYPNWFSGNDPIGMNERIAEAAARLASEKLAKAYKAFKEDTFLLEQTKKSYHDKSYFD
jgi:creatinine amidohydrolase